MQALGWQGAVYRMHREMVESMQAEHDDFQQSDANEGFKEQRGVEFLG
jgi:hypothetical protein